jgi:hypothetical protein
MAVMLSACHNNDPTRTATWAYVWREGFLPDEDAGIEVAKS